MFEHSKKLTSSVIIERSNMCNMTAESIRPNIGDTVIFHYRKEPSIQLEGCVVNVLENTIIVEIRKKETIHESQIEERQVVRHGKYEKRY